MPATLNAGVFPEMSAGLHVVIEPRRIERHRFGIDSTAGVRALSVWNNKGFTENELSWPAQVIVGLCVVTGLLIETAVAARNAVHGVVPRPWCSLVVLAGFLLFVFPKLQVVRHKRRVSFGTALMTESQANLYRLGYFLMGAGYLLTFR